MANEWLLPFVALTTAGPTARDRATNSVALTMMPVPPAMRGGVAALAVTQQASDGVRREVRVVSQTLDAVTLATTQHVAAADLDRFPALEAIDKAATADRLNQTVSDAAATTAEEVAGLARLLIQHKGQEIAGADLAKFPVLDRLLADTDLSGIVKSAQALAAPARKP